MLDQEALLLCLLLRPHTFLSIWAVALPKGHTCPRDLPNCLVQGSADRVWGGAPDLDTLALNTVRNAEHAAIYLTGKDTAGGGSNSLLRPGSDKTSFRLLRVLSPVRYREVAGGATAVRMQVCAGERKANLTRCSGSRHVFVNDDCITAELICSPACGPRGTRSVMAYFVL